jgi:hypothetical protein
MRLDIGLHSADIAKLERRYVGSAVEEEWLAMASVLQSAGPINSRTYMY